MNAWTFERFLSTPADEYVITLAISNGSVRAALSKKCADAGIGIFDIQAENSILMDGVNITEGRVLCSFTAVMSNASIGRHFHANIYSYAGHDCVIGDFVTFAPGVMCNGNVHVKDHAYIGAGAVLRQGSLASHLLSAKAPSLA